VRDGDIATRFVLDMRAVTASESLDESSSEDAEPDIESSRPEQKTRLLNIRFTATIRHTINKTCKIGLCDGITAVQTHFNIISMPI
jgi:hypothetical protein